MAAISHRQLRVVTMETQGRQAMPTITTVRIKNIQRSCRRKFWQTASTSGARRPSGVSVTARIRLLRSLELFRRTT